MSLVLNVMSQTLSGNYVNFGVFELYQDSSYTDSLTVSLKILLTMKLSDIMSYPKVTKIYFQFLSITFKYHLESLIKVDTNTFVKLIDAFREGLEVAADNSIINLCAASIDHIATFAFKNAIRGGHSSNALRSHLSTVPAVFTTFFVMLLNNVMYRNMTSCWSISRPLLSLLLANENTVVEAQRKILSLQPQKNHQPFQNAFNKMMVDINKTLETTNRDRFSQRVNIFRAEVKQFMVRPPEFDAV
jgi:exportin-7